MYDVCNAQTELESRDENLASVLETLCQSHPNQIALIEGSKRRTRTVNYKQLQSMVANKASMLRAHGLKSGDVVLVLEPMGIDLYVSILAVFRIGAAVAIIDAAAGKEILEHAVERVQPKAVIARGKGLMAGLQLKAVNAIRLKLADGFTPPGWRSLKTRPFAVSCHIEPVSSEHPALLTLTSGTSGKPKIIVRSHDFLLTQLNAVSKNCALAPGDTELTSLPVFVLANLASRVTTIIPCANLAKLHNLDISSVVDQIHEFKPRRILGSPIFIEKIVTSLKFQGLRLPFVDTIITGGGPVFPRLLRNAKQVFPLAKIVTVYGSSEAEPISKINFDDVSREDFDAITRGAGLPVGYPVGEVQVRIAPLFDQDEQLKDKDRLSVLRHICEIAERPIQAVGEIIVTGDHVVKGYDKGIGDEETKININGVIWHRTGDVGYLDCQGRLWLTGRLSKAASNKPNAVDTNFAQCVEAAALTDDSVGRAACVTVRGRSTLFIEGAHQACPVDTWMIKDKLNWSQLNAVKTVRAIPVDSRHASKVLYDKLTDSA